MGYCHWVGCCGDIGLEHAIQVKSTSAGCRKIANMANRGKLPFLLKQDRFAWKKQLNPILHRMLALKRQRGSGFLAHWRETIPVFQQCLPLSLKAREQMAQAGLLDSEDADHAVRQHVRSDPYLQNVLAHGHRYNLDGTLD